MIEMIETIEMIEMIEMEKGMILNQKSQIHPDPFLFPNFPIPIPLAVVFGSGSQLYSSSAPP